MNVRTPRPQDSANLRLLTAAVKKQHSLSARIDNGVRIYIILLDMALFGGCLAHNLQIHEDLDHSKPICFAPRRRDFELAVQAL